MTGRDIAPSPHSALDKILTVILAISIIIAVSLLIYVIITPKTGEKFTEFYLLGPNEIADDYPSNLIIGENASVILGVVNHEYKTIDYTIEVWLINQTTEDNITIYHKMWYLDKINTTLDHEAINIEEPWEPQWEYNYNFSITKKGSFKLAFLLFTKQTQNYDHTIDYSNIAEEKIDKAYRSLHMWLTVE